MAVSRVVKRSSLQQWMERGASKTYTDPTTVKDIIEVVKRDNIELDYETNTDQAVFIRIESIVKDKKREMPWSHSGGALTHSDPSTQIGITRYAQLKDIPFIKEREVHYPESSVTVCDEKNYVTLTINTSCEI